MVRRNFRGRSNKVILVLRRGIELAERRELEQLATTAGLQLEEIAGPVEDGRWLASVTMRGDVPCPDLVAQIKLWPAVEKVLDFADPHPLCRAASGDFRVFVGSAAEGKRCLSFGRRSLVWIAGPCSVENPDVLGETAQRVASAGASMLRGGAFKPRTSPYSFQGSGRDGLLLLSAVARDLGLPLVSEVLDPRDVDFVAQHVDVLQLGTRSMQNFPLLREAGRSGRPVLLKRGMSATLDEFLHAAEYVLHAGCSGLILCERGVRGFDPSRRNVLDLSVVPALKERTRLPVLVDPSHATGRRSLVIPMAKAAVAAGADGVMVEVHSRPQEALSDGTQALLPSDLDKLGPALRALARLEGRELVTAAPIVGNAAEERTLFGSESRPRLNSTDTQK